MALILVFNDDEEMSKSLHHVLVVTTPS